MNTNFEDIVKTHKAIIYNVSKSFMYDDFEDLYQEILIQIWHSLEGFQGQSKVSTWIYRIAFNTAITYSNKNRKTQNKKEEIHTQTHNIESGDTQSNEAKLDLLYKAINELKKDYRALILLQLEGYDYEEIAQVMGISKNLVGVKLKRAKSALERIIKKQ